MAWLVESSAIRVDAWSSVIWPAVSNADWWAAYREARAADVAGIAFWGGMWDKAVGERQDAS